MAWENVPICDKCWETRNRHQTPVRMRPPDHAICHYCGHPTLSGIYVRAEMRNATH